MGLPGYTNHEIEQEPRLGPRQDLPGFTAQTLV